MVCPYPSAVESGVLSIFTIFLPLFKSPHRISPPTSFAPPRAGSTTEVSVADVHKKAARGHTEIAGCFFFFFFFFSDWKGWRRSSGRESGKRENKRPHTSGGDGASGAGFQIYKQKYIYIHIYINVLYVHLKTPLTRSHYK